MIVYAESNFVLELAFLRADHENAERLLELSEAGRIRLVVPAFSLAEPHETLIRRAKARRSLLVQLSAEIDELARSKPYQALAQRSRVVTGVLAASEEDERHRLNRVVERVIAGADVIPLTAGVAGMALELQAELGLSAQDAIVYASVEAHLKRAPEQPRIFVNQNRKDFLTPDILDRLSGLHCRFIASFGGARAAVEKQLRTADASDAAPPLS
ncbi:PIN domain-containing protein [Longimicrobium sp.]|uniref:PIN domain-containing protein n=1 Tax=Longimicrobium sp. TaxID=2029185 RepID=UPI002E31610D|nr:PIN domain-containing protein [Longimicrobium sp.]HEX6038767.1 PIN domain-containing protein [Longimicrobium sp.]